MGEIKTKELGSIRNGTLDRYNAYRMDGLRLEANRFSSPEGFSYHNTPIAFPHKLLRAQA
jgi:hypothetical protein